MCFACLFFSIQNISSLYKPGAYSLNTFGDFLEKCVHEQIHNDNFYSVVTSVKMFNVGRMTTASMNQLKTYREIKFELNNA